MSEDKKLEISIPGEWALKKLLGPTSEKIGNDLATLYTAVVTKITTVAKRKTDNINDGKTANLRVVRDIFWNGGFSDDDICAEYFGGILASSRSEDGKDDSGIYYTDIIKSLSSKQLLFHYMIYNSLNKEFLAHNTEINVAKGSELEKKQIYFFGTELYQLGINVPIDAFALNSKDLISNFSFQNEKAYDISGKEIEVYLGYIGPSPLGIQLYSIINNSLDNWINFPNTSFGDFPDIPLVEHYSMSKKELLNKANLNDVKLVEEQK
ncbi:hypothetical protein SAMN02745116_00677 [Pilibacter termitis]|uniref:Uncharacterized protein n=1 Tax=Pilibacter termitis TaxID=263852 RepID=A0A1T4LIS1_9ENTE|nr:hypothetical protein [Pilibacter termitis]SJZ54623.1 hypothetical protein SAMN02745116_00677 [Pilibacter termitis]